MNRFRTLSFAPVLLAGALVAVGPRPLSAQAVDILSVNVKAVAEGYRSSKLIGKPVTNDKNQRIGTIDDIIIAKDRVLYAILQVGGFLGMGGRLIAVPFDDLQFDPADNKIVLPGATREELVKVPEFKFPA